MKENDGYLAEVKKREPIYDIIRVISCLCIIAIHCTDKLVETGVYDYIWYVGDIIQGIVRIALPMFVLLSGTLILNSKKEEPLWKFYLKRLLKIMLPLYIYSFIYLFVFNYNYSIDILMPMNFLRAIKQIAEGEVYFHLWFGYMIMGIYLCAPFLKKMCQSLTDKECKGLTVLIFIISAIKYLLPTYKINIGLQNIPFIDWTLIFLLGYLITREPISKHYKIIYILGIISWIIAVIAPRTNINLQNLSDFSVTMLFEVMAVYLFFVRNKEKICKIPRFNKIMTFLSTYTWEIFLLHGGVLAILEQFVNKEEMNLILWTFVMIGLVAVMSFILAFIIHNLIIKNLEKLINKILETIENKYKKVKDKST